MRNPPYGYRDGQPCCKDCEHTREGGPLYAGQRLRCYRIAPSRAVGANKTCLESKWRKAK